MNGPPGAPPPAPDDARTRFARFDELVARGETTAARAVLVPFESSADPERAEARARLALLDEQEGRARDALVRWEKILADDIDDDRAWSHVTRLRAEATPAPARAGNANVLGLAAPTLDAPTGVKVGRFEILRELGRGGSATVYLARDRELDLPLALKVLHPRGGTSGAELDRRFFHEARMVAALRHPGVVAIYDIDEPRRTLVMEHVPGGTLRDRLRSQRRDDGATGLPLAEIDALVRRLLFALDHVHGQGVVHGDLTPRNVLLRAPGEPVLVDFGLARVDSAEASVSDAPAGTPLYLAPEQFRGAPSSQRTDLFAVGALLWEALAGQPLRTRADLLADRNEPRPLPARVLQALGGSAARLSNGLCALTAPRPEQRPVSAREALRLFEP